MAYSPTKDQFPNERATRESFGTKGRMVTPHDTNDLDPYAKAIVVVATGNLVVLPLMGTDGTNITITDAPVGFILPWPIRRVLLTGTTATVATVED